MRKIACIPSMAALLIIIYSAGSVNCYYQDSQQTADGTFTAFSSTIWTQTTQDDFEEGVVWRVDTDKVPGDVLLQRTGNHYRASGYLSSEVYNTGSDDTTIDLLFWDGTVLTQTSVTFSVRASNTEFSASSSTPSWINIGTLTPVSAGLPRGQYIQWRVDLATSNNAVTPALHEVQVWFH
jgi:hypothetical protein